METIENSLTYISYMKLLTQSHDVILFAPTGDITEVIWGITKCETENMPLFSRFCFIIFIKKTQPLIRSFQF